MTDSIPRLDSLVRWFATWITDDGAINGFHNHSVWGTNPYTFSDFTSGHAAFSAPALGALGQLVAAAPDHRAVDLWRRMMTYQSTALQPDDQYRHVGFQVGESATAGLIHNATGSIGLLTGLVHARHLLAQEEVSRVLGVVRRNLDALATFGGGRPSREGTCNQEYARVWVKLLYSSLSDDDTFVHEIPEDLDALIELYHVRGVPDHDSTGTLRYAPDRDTGGILEPAEYYGLEIMPLVLAAETYGEPRWLDEATRLARHLARSAWIDESGMTRFHRYWYVDGERTLKSDLPMLIAGMGLSLHGITALLRVRPDAELERFVEACLRTYAHYQTPAGYFASATGWHNEADVAPSTAWHAHDLLFLADRLPMTDGFWDAAFTPTDRISVLTTDRASWIEDDSRWAIRSPYTAGDLSIYGRKDSAVFQREFFAWTDKPPLPEELTFAGAPEFFVSNDGIRRMDAGTVPVDVTTLGHVSYLGSMRP